jgi:hypothetical protein
VRAGALIAASALLLGACATTPAPRVARELYMVMPEEDGGVGVVDVTLNDGRQFTLVGEYRALAAEGGEARAFVADRDALDRAFGPTLAALPRPPVSLMLQFLRGRDEPIAESRRVLEQIARDFRERPSMEIQVIGHADSVGSDAFNDALSLRRAQRVRQLLLELGVRADSVALVGRGKREPLVPTPDNTDEPRNRRVEVTVR